MRWDDTDGDFSERDLVQRVMLAHKAVEHEGLLRLSALGRSDPEAEQAAYRRQTTWLAAEASYRKMLAAQRQKVTA